MKNRYILILVLAVVAFSCEDEENLNMNDQEVSFNGKSAVIQSQKISNVRLKNLSGDITIDETVPEGQVRIESSEDVEGVLKVKVENGELRFEGNHAVQDSVDLDFYMNPLDLEKIVVEGDNKVYISSTPLLDYLEIVTEGSSTLTINDLKVRDLKSRREGKSQMILSGEATAFARDSVYFADSVVTIVENRYIFYTEEDAECILVAPSIKVRNDSVFAIGDNTNPLDHYFITNTHEMVNQGESYLDALELPTAAIVSKNEGKSESKVWALQHLEVKGEGESVMHYAGSPEIDETLNGNAALYKAD